MESEKGHKGGGGVPHQRIRLEDMDRGQVPRSNLHRLPPRPIKGLQHPQERVLFHPQVSDPRLQSPDALLVLGPASVALQDVEHNSFSQSVWSLVLCFLKFLFVRRVPN